MKENPYDDPDFFLQYSHIDRSVKGLEGAGEWYRFREMLPSFKGKRVLDLGCGFGWHCRYAAEQGALSVTGVDLSEKMLAVAQEKNGLNSIVYRQASLGEVEFADAAFDIVLSSLAFHYLESFAAICRKVARWTAPAAHFVFSVEHPVFTAQGPQQWILDQEGRPLYWPVDNYYTEGRRDAVFLGQHITKYHRTLTTYINDLLEAGFAIRKLVEPQPAPELLRSNAAMKEELRRPMMLLIASQKTGQVA